jgi:hypothetical protein
MRRVGGLLLQGGVFRQLGADALQKLFGAHMKYLHRLNLLLREDMSLFELDIQFHRLTS